jgi:hypothetical protein
MLSRRNFHRRRLLLGLIMLTIATGATSAQAAVDKVTHIDERAGDPVPVPLGGSISAYARCHHGEQLVGGGASVTASAPSTSDLQASSPDPAHPQRRWLARAYGADDISDVTAYAFCARSGGRDHVKGIVRRVGDPVTVPGSGEANAFASCHSDEQLVGGGAQGSLTSPSGVMFLRVSAPDPHDPALWKARAHSYGSPEDLTAVAFCAKSHVPHGYGDLVKRIVQRGGVAEPAPDAQDTDAFASCDGGEQLVGGGAYGSTTNPSSHGDRLKASAPKSLDSFTRVWRARFYNAGNGGEIAAFAFCADD